ncbi:MAG TPA: GNAT family N-acetyltransferase [Candidatus Binataceae bacterium]|nr:GNAT family N-acetyltransferase [Candidatus Binataceae bacterium]
MPVKPKKFRRRRPSGELTIEQSHETGTAASILDATALIIANDTVACGGCLLVAYLGDEPVGLAALVTEVDSGLIRLMFVSAKMRGHRVGHSILSAVRDAAHTRGARQLYAAVQDDVAEYFTRMGFGETQHYELAMAFGQTMLERLGCNHLTGYRVLRLDLSSYGVIER